MYDIIGDVHGHYSKLVDLIRKLDYKDTQDGFVHKDGRKLVFVGDLTDRGEDSAMTLDLVLYQISKGNALAVLGNHCRKAIDSIRKNKAPKSAALVKTLDEFRSYWSEYELKQVIEEWASLPTSLTLDDGKLIVVHGAHPIHGETGAKAMSLNLYSYTSGRQTPEGYPERLDWAEDYRGDSTIVHGHQVVSEVYVKNNVWNIDTGCYKGGKLTCLRYPEMDIVQV